MSLSSAYRAGKTDRQSDGWMDKVTESLILVRVQTGSQNMQLFALAKYVLGEILCCGFLIKQNLTNIGQL